jgi:hypothetical protein
MELRTPAALKPNDLITIIPTERVSGKGMVQLELQRVAIGMHIVGLYFDGHLIGTEKLQMIR